jgi:hypothetical protein
LSSERAQVTCEGVDVDFGSRGWAAKLLAIWVGSGRETPGVFIILGESVSSGKITILPLRGRVGVERANTSAGGCRMRTRDMDGKSFFIFGWTGMGLAVSGKFSLNAVLTREAHRTAFAHRQTSPITI